MSRPQQPRARPLADRRRPRRPHLHRRPSRFNLERQAWRAGARRVAGVDEAGRGPIAGPVVAAAVVLKSQTFRHPIDDSKRLSAKQREAAFEEILRQADVGIGIVEEGTIDQVNIYRATCVAMEQAIARLDPSADCAIVDGRLKLKLSIPYRCIPGGDGKSLSIACASIVAKVTRDRLMAAYDRLFPGYQFAQHKGYGTARHKSALATLGLSPIHRLSFAPCSSF